MPSPPDPGAISSRAKLPAAREELRGLAGEKETSRLHGLDLPHLTSSPEMNYCLCHSPIRSGTGGAKKLPDPGMGREERLGLRSSDAPRTSRPQAQRIPSLANEALSGGIVRALQISFFLFPDESVGIEKERRGSIPKVIGTFSLGFITGKLNHDMFITVDRVAYMRVRN
ncbi:hypothetical protein EJB05_39747, partial [Eragrostis curvula]